MGPDDTHAPSDSTREVSLIDGPELPEALQELRPDHPGYRPRHVAVIGNSAASLRNFRIPLIREILSRGHRVTVLAPDLSAEEARLFREVGADGAAYSLSPAGLNPLRDLRDTVRLAAQLRSLGAEIVLSYTPKCNIFGSLAAFLAGTERRYALVAGLGYMFGDSAASRLKYRLTKPLVKLLYRLALRRCDRVFFQNPDDLDELVNAGVVERRRCERVYGSGVDLDEFPVVPQAAAPLSFVMVARLLREKGVLDFVAAARTVKQRHPAARFILVGGPADNPDSISSADAQQWHAEGLIEWAGEVRDVRPYLRQAAVFVLPSYYREGTPRSTLEAMACGRAVITTRSPGCKETVIDGRTGYLVPPRDPQALAAAMLRFLDEPSLVETMGRESRALCEALYDVRSVNRQMLESMSLPAA
ncbi:MAG TPA: glycosyltransferase family 4 protein [Solimonas sp.]|nr:glycosyltransferase family 4 protein [Solimonas sp.]